MYDTTGFPEILAQFKSLERRYSVISGGAAPFKMGKTCLDILLCLVRNQRARDPTGAPLLPLPKVHRQIASPTALPHIAQVAHLMLLQNTHLSRFVVV